jgi:hypothetical protein
MCNTHGKNRLFSPDFSSGFLWPFSKDYHVLHFAIILDLNKQMLKIIALNVVLLPVIHCVFNHI